MTESDWKELHSTVVAAMGDAAKHYRPSISWDQGFYKNCCRSEWKVHFHRRDDLPEVEPCSACGATMNIPDDPPSIYKQSAEEMIDACLDQFTKTE